MDPNDRPAAPRRAKVARRGPLRPWGVIALLLLVVTLVLHPYRIPSASMADTLQPGDFILVDALAFGARLPLPRGARLPALRPPHRGEVVVLSDPERPGAACVKRCIALGGDRVVLRDGGVWVNGARLSEPYVKEPAVASDSASFVVPPRALFVLGDDRAVSRDSRAFGCVNYAALLGRPLLVYFSWDDDRGRVRADRLLERVH
jgi:signal peptidase I